VEIIFDTVNAISTVEDTDNRIIVSPKINEKHYIDCSIFDYSYVIDLNINSNILTCSSFKIDASQCDKWKSLKYQNLKD